MCKVIFQESNQVIECRIDRKSKTKQKQKTKNRRESINREPVGKFERHIIRNGSEYGGRVVMKEIHNSPIP